MTTPETPPQTNEGWQGIDLPDMPPITSSADIAEWLDAVATGRWTWTRNTRCKYVDLKLDTRRGAYSILDRNGRPITFEQLRWQYPEPAPTPEPRA